MNNKPVLFFASLMFLTILLVVIYQLKTDPFQNVSRQTQQNQANPHNADDVITLYTKNCSVCHGKFGEGQGTNPSLQGTELTHEEIANFIRSGGDEMPSFPKLTPAQVHQLVELVQKL